MILLCAEVLRQLITEHVFRYAEILLCVQDDDVSYPKSGFDVIGKSATNHIGGVEQEFFLVYRKKILAGHFFLAYN
jgi:hypothetical protein